MDIKHWNNYYKVDPIDLTRCTTNALYTPYVNPEKTVMCMSWDATDVYQNPANRPLYTTELVNFFFNRELYYLEKTATKPWAPEIIDIDYSKQRIFFKWYGMTCNDILYDNNIKQTTSLSRCAENWSTQLQNIVTELISLNVYKMSLYPHCMYFDNSGTLHTFDFYASVDVSDPYIERSVVESIIGEQSVFRFDSATVGTKINFEVFFKNTLKYIKWPDNTLEKVLENL